MAILGLLGFFEVTSDLKAGGVAAGRMMDGALGAILPDPLRGRS